MAGRSPELSSSSRLFFSFFFCIYYYFFLNVYCCYRLPPSPAFNQSSSDSSDWGDSPSAAQTSASSSPLSEVLMRFWTADLEMMIDLTFICRTWIGIAYASGEQTRGAVTHTPTRARALSLSQRSLERETLRAALVRSARHHCLSGPSSILTEKVKMRCRSDSF